jgi:F-box and WD-40 domain protein CDC4
MTWKNLCVKHDYGRRMSEVYTSAPMISAIRPSLHPLGHVENEFASGSFPGALPLASAHASGSRSFDGSQIPSQNRPKLRSYKSHFKQRYLVEAAWRSGGESVVKNITQEGGVVTSLHLTPKYIVVALDNAKIHVFDTEGDGQRTLQGHVMGVWAMVPWEDTLVSGGCDRDVRVWDLTTG